MWWLTRKYGGHAMAVGLTLKKKISRNSKKDLIKLQKKVILKN